MTTSATKGWRAGTHRVVPPSDTLARLRPLLPEFGITRIANVTGLDTVGLPVVMVVRPNSRSLSVSQGKGLTLDAATVSGVMESVESWHAEHMTHPLRLTTTQAMATRARIADTDRMVRQRTSRFTTDLPILWVEGTNLFDSESMWLPYETVHTNFTVPRPEGSGCFACTSNGLASGNHVQEATSHALSEVIERDAIALWSLVEGEAGASRRVDLATVDDPDCRSVLDRYVDAGVAVAVWDITSDIGVACYFALIVDREIDPFRLLFAAGGSGCHPSRSIALLRALTEAAQSRLTAISGARDDILPPEYEHLRTVDVIEQQRRYIVDATPARSFTDAPDYESSSFDGDVAWMLDRLQAVGIEQAVAVDLTDPAYAIPVMRVVVPGLEGPTEKGGDLILMERAERAMAAGRVPA